MASLPDYCSVDWSIEFREGRGTLLIYNSCGNCANRSRTFTLQHLNSLVNIEARFSRCTVMNKDTWWLQIDDKLITLAQVFLIQLFKTNAYREASVVIHDSRAYDITSICSNTISPVSLSTYGTST